MVPMIPGPILRLVASHWQPTMGGIGQQTLFGGTNTTGNLAEGDAGIMDMASSKLSRGRPTKIHVVSPTVVPDP